MAEMALPDGFLFLRPPNCEFAETMNSEHLAQETTEFSARERPGLSGRRVTLCVLAALVLVAGGVSYALFTYNRIDFARAQSADAWRELADQLAGRYRRAENAIARGVDKREIDMKWGEKFRLAVDRFRTTAQSTLQFAAACELEDLLRSQQMRLEVSAGLRDAVAEYNVRRAVERSALDSWGGRFLSMFLQFPEPVDLDLAVAEAR